MICARKAVVESRAKRVIPSGDKSALKPECAAPCGGVQAQSGVGVRGNIRKKMAVTGNSISRKIRLKASM
jgi:hypothetical protein